MFTIEFKKLGFRADLSNTLISKPFGWNIEIGWNMIFFLIAVISGVLFAYFSLKKDCRKKVDFPDYLLSCFFAGLLGARFGYILASGSQSEIHSLFDFFNPLVGGLSLAGGILFALVAGGICCKVKKLSVSRFFDVSSQALFLGLIFGTVSDFLAGGGIGLFSAGLLWGVSVDGRGPFHPLFLYHFLASLIGFIFVFVYDKFFRRVPGETFSLALFLFGAERAAVSVFDNGPLFWLGVNIPLVLYSVSSVLGLVLLILFRFGFIGALREKKEAEKAEKEIPYQNLYKPLLEEIPQTYIADKETIEASLKGTEDDKALAESGEDQRINENSEESENGTDHKR